MTMEDITIALARASDADRIAGMSRELIESGLEWSWTPRRVNSSIRSPNSNVIVARVENRIAGFGIMSYGEDEAHLNLLAVAGAWRRRGLGRGLVEWLEKPALVAGITAVFLEVRSNNRGAQVFYERLGYRKLARIRGYYQGRESATRMGRELGTLSRIM